MRFLPPSASRAARRLVLARAMRGFADGLVSVLLATYLSELGFSPFRVGAIVTATLLGSAALTLSLSLYAHRVHVRSLLLCASVLMLCTGLGFGVLTQFWPILLVAALGTLNPSAGDVSVFLPTEQSFLAGEVADSDRPRLYGVYNLAGALAAAFGALASAIPGELSERMGWELASTQRLGFALYALVAVAVGVVYRGLPPRTKEIAPSQRRRKPLEQSRRIVLELAALFSLDSAGGGFAVQSLLVLWLHLRFGLSTATTGAVFFAVGVLSGASQLASGPLASRIGLIKTMVFTHLPANVLLVLAAFAPRAWLAVVLLLGRAALSQMDVPARQSFVMAVVPVEERVAAASVTNVPRSLAAAATPLIAGFLLTKSSFGWPLVVGGVMKIVYDLMLLALYRAVPEEVGAVRERRARSTG